MKKQSKGNIRNLVNLEEKDGLTKTIERLQKRYSYLERKNYRGAQSKQMKYIQFHMRKYQNMYAGGIR